MNIIKPLIAKITFIPTIEMNDDLKYYFSVFFAQTILFLFVTPIVLSVPAFLLFYSFSVPSLFISITIFLIGVIILLTWLFVSIFFFFSVTEPNSWPRYVALSWLVLLMGTLTTWILFFKTYI
jgi:hypothetical protein